MERKTMKKINYKRINEIVVNTQAELDAIPDDFEGKIYVKSDTVESDTVIIIRKKYLAPVIVSGNSYVVAKNNACVEAFGDSYVVADENAYVIARNNTCVIAKGYSHIKARENSIITARENSSVMAFDNSSVKAFGSSDITAYDISSVVAYDKSCVIAIGNSNVVATANSRIEAFGNASIEAWGYSSVSAKENVCVKAFEYSNIIACQNSIISASGNVQVIDKQKNGEIQISGNARIVRAPQNISGFLDFYNIKHTDTKAIFYKAVHRTDQKDVFKSSYDPNFEYIVGQTKTELCNGDASLSCTFGIHISYLEWALDFGLDWDDLAIIECETKISNILIPENTDGKVRTSEIKVLREVPLEQCGTYGKMLAKIKS